MFLGHVFLSRTQVLRVFSSGAPPKIREAERLLQKIKRSWWLRAIHDALQNLQSKEHAGTSTDISELADLTNSPETVNPARHALPTPSGASFSNSIALTPVQVLLRPELRVDMHHSNQSVQRTFFYRRFGSISSVRKSTVPALHCALSGSRDKIVFITVVAAMPHCGEAILSWKLRAASATRRPLQPRVVHPFHRVLAAKTYFGKRAASRA